MAVPNAAGMAGAQAQAGSAAGNPPARERTLNEAQLEAIYEHAPVMVAVIDSQLRLVRANRALAEFSGRDPETLVGMELCKALGCVECAGTAGARATQCADCGFWGAARSLFSLGRSTRRLEHTLCAHRNGETVEASLLVSCVGLNVAGVQEALVCIEDISELKRVEAHFHQVQKMELVGRLVGGIAHDFNNLLTVILTASELAALDAGVPPDSRDCLRDIAGAARRGAHLVRQLTAYGRRSMAILETTDLNAFLRDSRELLRRTLGEVIQLEFDYGKSLPSILANRTLLEHVLLNLAVNAKDAMPAGGRLNIVTRLETSSDRSHERDPENRPGAYVTLSVTDTGYGMDKEILDRIFEPFFTTKDVGKGSGLGLSSVEGIVRQLKGWIQVVSQPGQGSTFRVFFPALPQPAAATPAPSFGPGQAEPAKRILLADDDADFRLWAADTLRAEGYLVQEASNGLEAVSLWHACQGDVDLVVTDLSMPEGLNGIELVQALRKTGRALRVLFVTGHSQGLLGHDLQVPEGEAMLTKPFEPAAFLAAVRNCLGTETPRPH